VDDRLDGRRLAMPRNQSLSSVAGGRKLQKMTAGLTRLVRRLNTRKVRLLIYLVILLGIVVWTYVPRPWKPARTIETPHYIIASTASPAQTEEIGRVVELLYSAYSNRFGALPTFRREHPRLKLLLYKFEQTIGPVAAIEPEWYRHIQRIEAALHGKDRDFFKTGQLPPNP
jgi:hypothetical protein